MQDLIARIAGATGLEPGVIEKAVGIVLAFLAKEGPQTEVEQLFDAIPGAQQAATADDGAATSGGGLMGMLGGGGGGIMAMGSKLAAAGVPMGQMQTFGRELFGYAREKIGDDAMNAIVGAIPGASQFV